MNTRSSHRSRLQLGTLAALVLAGCATGAPPSTVKPKVAETPAVQGTTIPTPRPSGATPEPVATGTAVPSPAASPTPVALPSLRHDAVPFAVRDGRLAVYDGSAYKPLFLAGMNIGVGLPGTSAGELAPSKDQYRRWFERMRTMGINCVRLYTLHMPRCYEALAEHNALHPTEPMYVLQGIWLDEDTPDGDLVAASDGFDKGAQENVLALHGAISIDQRPGRAWGQFTVDVSPYVLAWVIGREMQPDEVLTTNARHPELTSFAGKALKLASGNATEAWLAARMDHVLQLEQDAYQVGRPIGFSSWPTLDPLTHAGEVVPQSYEDAATVDLANLEAVDAPGGTFACFHAYPYYPNFMTEEDTYANGHDAQGPNPYVAYVQALVDHYKPMPVVIGEFGVPSSWGNAHNGAGGMSHGGLDEGQQGEDDARLLGDIHDSGAAGAVAFAWIDEWWKRTWITDPVALPRERYPLWHNITSPEQNFGLIGFEPPAPDMGLWAGASGTGRLRRVKAAADAAFLHIDVELDAPLTDADQLTMGLDTYRADLGESVLPGGGAATNRCEFALQLTRQGAQLFVTRAYDTVGIWHHTSEDDQRFQSLLSDGAPWDLLRWQNSGEHRAQVGSKIWPAVYADVGTLRVDTGTSLDAVRTEGNTLHLQLPWTFLNVTDPSAGKVLDDNKQTPLVTETAQSDGVAFTLSLGSDTLVTPRYVWPTWEQAPVTTEREKASLPIFARAVQALSDRR